MEGVHDGLGLALVHARRLQPFDCRVCVEHEAILRAATVPGATSWRGISRPYKKKPTLEARALVVKAAWVYEAPKPMREQQNPSTPELHQPLLFAPSELLACGLRDAHYHPLVGVRTEAGVRSWRTSPATAWEHPLVEWARTATSYYSIVLDCDSRESQ